MNGKIFIGKVEEKELKEVLDVIKNNRCKRKECGRGEKISPLKLKKGEHKREIMAKGRCIEARRE